MSDWDPHSGGGPPRIGNRSGEAVLMRALRALLNWFGSMNALAVILVTGALTCLAGLFLIQAVSRTEAPRPPADLFGAMSAATEPRLPEPFNRGRTLSSLEFVQRMEQRPSSVKPALAAAAPQPAAQPGPQMPAVPQIAMPQVNPQEAAAKALAGMKAPSSGGNNSVAAGAHLGAAQPEPAPRQASAGPDSIGSLGAASAAEGGDSEIARRLLPLVRAYQQGSLHGFNSSAAKNYAVDLGRAMMQGSLSISTSTIVTAKDAHALAEGLGVHIPKSK